MCFGAAGSAREGGEGADLWSSDGERSAGSREVLDPHNAGRRREHQDVPSCDLVVCMITTTSRLSMSSPTLIF